MLRLIVNKSRHHYNLALEHAERGRLDEAIGELHNSIDLDRNFPGAHVVLGTLHAKRDEFDKAREAWNAALSLSPELNKAHSYLQKVEARQSAAPIIRRLRLAILGVAVIAIALGAALIFRDRHTHERARLDNALAAYEQGKYGEALTLLVGIRTHKDADRNLASAANALEASIRNNMRSEVRAVQEMKFRGEFPEALASIARLQREKPDDETSVALATIREDINHYYRQGIEQLYDDYVNGEVSYDELEGQVEEYLAIYPDVPEKEELRDVLARAQNMEVEGRFDEIRLAFEQDHDVTLVRKSLQELAERYPENESLQSGRATLVEEVLSWMFEHLQELMGEKEFHAAEDLLEQINDVATEYKSIVDVTGAVELAQRVLEDEEKTELLVTIGSMIEDGDTSAAREAVTQVSTDDTLTTGERELLQSYEQQLHALDASDQAQKIRSNERKFLTLSISDAEASSTLSGYGDLLGYLPRDASAQRTSVLAAAAASAIKLDQETTATAIMERLREHDPKARQLTELDKLLKKGKEPRETKPATKPSRTTTQKKD